MTLYENQDLAWLAFRYVSAEMEPDERASFEDRLADDQTAREAVAQSVQLIEAITALPLQPFHTTRRARRRLRVAGWLVTAAAAASLAFLLIARAFVSHAEWVWLWRSSERSSQVDESTRSTGELLGIVLAWFELQQEHPEAWQSETALDADEHSATSGLEAGPPEIGVPGWLVAAVSESRKRGNLEDDWEEN